MDTFAALMGFLFATGLSLDPGLDHGQPTAPFPWRDRAATWNAWGAASGDLFMAAMGLGLSSLLLQLPVTQVLVWLSGAMVLSVLVIQQVSLSWSLGGSPSSLALQEAPRISRFRPPGRADFLAGFRSALSAPASVLGYGSVGGSIAAASDQGVRAGLLGVLAGIALSSACGLLLTRIQRRHSWPRTLRLASAVVGSGWTSAALLGMVTVTILWRGLRPIGH